MGARMIFRRPRCSWAVAGAVQWFVAQTGKVEAWIRHLRNGSSQSGETEPSHHGFRAVAPPTDPPLLWPVRASFTSSLTSAARRASLNPCRNEWNTLALLVTPRSRM